MGDGWETARQPLRPACYKRQADGLMLLPGQDWALLKCGKQLTTTACMCLLLFIYMFPCCIDPQTNARVTIIACDPSNSEQ